MSARTHKLLAVAVAALCAGVALDTGAAPKKKEKTIGELSARPHELLLAVLELPNLAAQPHRVVDVAHRCYGDCDDRDGGGECGRHPSPAEHHCNCEGDVDHGIARS